MAPHVSRIIVAVALGDVWLEWMQMSRRERFNIKSKSLKEAQQTIANAEHAYQHQRRQRQVGMKMGREVKETMEIKIHLGGPGWSEFWMLWQVHFCILYTLYFYSYYIYYVYLNLFILQNI